MIVLESLLVTVLITIFLVCGYTDIRYGLIKNFHLKYALGVIVLADIIYYGVFAGEYFSSFCVNAVMLCIVSIILYGLKIWAGGDSKLLILVALGLPGRFYNLHGHSSNTSVMIIAIAFMFAFLGIVIQSLYWGLKEGTLFCIAKQKIDYKRMLATFGVMFSFIQLVNIILHIYFFDFVIKNSFLLQFCNCLIVLTLLSFVSKLSFQKSCLLTALSVGLIICLCSFNNFTIIREFNLRLLPLIIAVVLLRFMIAKYSYKHIPTDKVKAGQILAASTIMQFQLSKVKGLPQNISEDLSAKLTEAEAECVRRWKSSKFGQETVLVVRKIPFAIYIALGTVMFVVLEVTRL